MTVTIEILKEEALALLRNLEQLKLLQFVSPKKKAEKTTEKLAAQPDNKLSEQISEDSPIKPLRQEITVDDILKEQHFQGFDRAEIDRLIKEIDVQEPIEELLAMLKA